MLNGTTARPMDPEAGRGGAMRKRILRLRCSHATALGFLGLALAVALWGFSYKLSRYDYSLSGSLSRVPVAKLWLEQRFATGGIQGTAKLVPSNSRIYAQPGANALHSYSPVLGFDSDQTLPVRAVRPRAVPFFHSAIPLRSPPISL